MAKARIQLAETADETDTREAAENLAKLNQATGGDLFTVIEELSGSAGASATVCLVTRIASEGRSGGYCGKIPVSDFTLDKVKSLFGPGKYQVQIKGPKGFVPGGGAVEIADTGESMHKPATPQGEFQSYLEFVRHQDEQRRDKTTRLLELGIPVLGTVIAGLLNRPSGPDIGALITALKPAPGPTLADLSTAMVNLKTLNAPASGGGDAIDTVLKVFEAARDLSDGGGGSKGGSNWIDLVRDTIKELPAIGGAAMAALRARGVAAQPTGNIAAIAPPPGAPPVLAAAPSAAPSAIAAPGFAGNAAELTGDNMLALMKPYMLQKLKLISGWASENKNPQLYAELFLTEHIPSNFADYLPPEKALEYLNHEQWFEKTTEWEPALAPHRAWCDKFRQELIVFITMSLSDDSAAPGAPIDEGAQDSM